MSYRAFFSEFNPRSSAFIPHGGTKIIPIIVQAQILIVIKLVSTLVEP